MTCFILDEPPTKLYTAWCKDRVKLYQRMEPHDTLRDAAPVLPDNGNIYQVVLEGEHSDAMWALFFSEFDPELANNILGAAAEEVFAETLSHANLCEEYIIDADTRADPDYKRQYSEACRNMDSSKHHTKVQRNTRTPTAKEEMAPALPTAEMRSTTHATRQKHKTDKKAMAKLIKNGTADMHTGEDA